MPLILLCERGISELNSKLDVQFFLNKDNLNNVITLGNLRGGKLKDIRGVKYGRLVTLYVQINDITVGGTDVTLLSFKRKEYAPLQYGVHNAYINRVNNACYIGQFSNGSVSWAINGDAIDDSHKAMVIFTITYITSE